MKFTGTVIFSFAAIGLIRRRSQFWGRIGVCGSLGKINVSSEEVPQAEDVARAG